MNRKHIYNKAILLADVSLDDWIKIKAVVDLTFEKKRKELEKEIKFPNSKEIQESIRSLFG